MDELRLYTRPNLRDEIRQIVATHGRIVSLEAEARARNGETRQAVLAVEAVEMDGEQCFITNIIDLTERRMSEELDQRLAHASRLTAMGELTASIAHEINQPMSAILANVDAAEMLLESSEPRFDELRGILDDIRNDDLRASEVIRHVRGLANKRDVEMQPFDLNELIAASLRLIAPVAQRRRVMLRSTYGALPQIVGDRIYIQQVLLNLLFNGMDAMAGVPENARTIDVSSAIAGTNVEVTVHDCGHGIPASQIESIFQSFFTTKKEGMGLGLSIARSLVQAHGGTIRGENDARGGATFRFTLPVQQRMPADSISRTRSPPLA